MKKKQHSKADFIKSQSVNTSAKDVITEAKAQGLEINADYVYSVRSEMRRKVKISPAQKAAVKRARAKAAKLSAKLSAKPAKRANAPEAPTDSRAALVLMAAASELGFGRAIELLTNERKRVRGILG